MGGGTVNQGVAVALVARGISGMFRLATIEWGAMRYRVGCVVAACAVISPSQSYTSPPSCLLPAEYRVKASGRDPALFVPPARTIQTFIEHACRDVAMTPSARYLYLFQFSPQRSPEESSRRNCLRAILHHAEKKSMFEWLW